MTHREVDKTTKKQGGRAKKTSFLLYLYPLFAHDFILYCRVVLVGHTLNIHPASGSTGGVEMSTGAGRGAPNT